MYDFYYGYLKAKYQERCSLLFTDTDSLCCEIQTEDLYRDIGENLELFDTSNFESNHLLYSTQNHRVLGKFKSETGSMAPAEFVGLKPKMYSLWTPGTPSKCYKKVKGVPKKLCKKHLRHQNFLQILNNAKTKCICKFRTFRSEKHVVNTIELSKTCLSGFDDKRFVCSDGINTLAYGHRRIV